MDLTGEDFDVPVCEGDDRSEWLNGTDKGESFQRTCIQRIYGLVGASVDSRKSAIPQMRFNRDFE